jgi:hypothetical protein
VEAVTGKPMDPTVKEPLPGQGGGGVLSASNVLVTDYSSPADEQRRLKAMVQGAVAPIVSRESAVSYASPADEQSQLNKTARSAVAGVIPAAEAASIAPPKPDPSIMRARPGWEKEKMTFKPPMSGGNVIVEPAQPKREHWKAPEGKPGPNYVARMMQEMPEKMRTEQDMLDKLAGEGRSLTRTGNVFKYADPTEKRPGYSGVTFSDTIEGAGLGQKTPPAADAQTMEELRGLYKGLGKAQGDVFRRQGLSGQVAELNAPAVTRGERGQNLQLRSGLTARDQMMQTAAAAIKPGDALAMQKFEYERGRDESNDDRAKKQKQQEFVMDVMKTQTPPGPLTPEQYGSALNNFIDKGYDPIQVIGLMQASGNNPDLIKAFERMNKGKLKDGEENPYERWLKQIQYALDQEDV